MEDTIEAIKRGEVTIPYKNRELEWVLHEWSSLNSTAERDQSSNRPIAGQQTTKFGRDGDDHAFHALLYARIALNFLEDGGLPQVRVFGG